MQKHIFLIITIMLLLVVGNISSAVCSGIKTLSDFEGSTFIKKYHQTKQMDSWALRNGRYNNSFSFSLGNDAYSWFSIEVVTTNATNPAICNYGIMFHDESNPNIYPTKFTNQIKTVMDDFLKSIDSSINIKEVVGYVNKRSTIKYSKIADAPAKTFGKYSFRIGTVGYELIIDIDKEK